MRDQDVVGRMACRGEAVGGPAGSCEMQSMLTNQQHQGANYHPSIIQCKDKSKLVISAPARRAEKPPFQQPSASKRKLGPLVRS